MSGVILTILTTILSVEFVTGVLGNGFIALVNCMDWLKRRKISLVDQILTALAISRIAQIWFVLLNWWRSMLYQDDWFTGTLFKRVYISWTVTSHFSIWFATSLSIFYFLKIANFSNTVFLYLKYRVKKVVSVTLLVSLVLLCLNVIVANTEIGIWTEACNKSTSYSFCLNNTQFVILTSFANTMFMFIPFAVSLITFLLLITSLWKHLRKMQRNTQGRRDASTAAHITALQNVVVFLLLYAVFFVSFAVKIWSSLFLERELIVLVTQITRAVFISLHSCILVLGHTNLRQSLRLVLRWLGCRSNDCKPSGP